MFTDEFETSKMDDKTNQELIDRVKAATAGKDYKVIVIYINKMIPSKTGPGGWKSVTIQMLAVQYTSYIDGRKRFIGEVPNIEDVPPDAE